MPNHQQIAHLWANGTDKHYADDTLFAESGTIYSYGKHFPIARKYKNGTACLFTSRSYSCSTAKHKSYVRQAIASSCEVFAVPEVATCGNDIDKQQHKANYKYLVEQIGVCLGKASKAKGRKMELLANAAYMRHCANRYSIVFGLRYKAIETSRSESDMLAIERYKILAVNAIKATRERADNLAKYEAWKRGESRGGGFSAFPVAFRIVGDEVQTSLGASFPVRHAMRIKGMIKSIRQDGIKGRPSDDFTVGHYRIDEVTENGIVAGCHKVTWEAIDELAAMLDTYQPAGESTSVCHNGTPIE